MTGSFLHSHRLSIKHLKQGIISTFSFLLRNSKHLYFIVLPYFRSLDVSIQDHMDVISQTEYFKKLALLFRKKAIVLTMIILPVSSGAGIGALSVLSDDTTQQPIAEINTIIDLTEDIVVTFDAPVINKNYRESIIIEPKRIATAQWNDERNKLTITPQGSWEPQTKYTLTLPSGTYENGDPIIQTALSFETAELPSVSVTYPVDGEEDFYLHKNEGMQIIFNRELRDYYVDFVITPSIAHDVKTSDDRSSFTLFPLEDLQRNTEYSITVYANLGKDQENKPKPIDQFTFTTLPEEPEEWPEDFNERLAEIKRFTIPQITEGKYIDVNLDAQVTTLFHNGEFVASFVDSTGTDAEPTPTGEFEIYNKDEYALSNMYQVHLPFWMAFTPDGLYGFHDLPIWPVGHEERPEGGTESLASIGRQASPGCVRHDTDDSQTLFEWSDIGTKVIIY